MLELVLSPPAHTQPTQPVPSCSTSEIRAGQPATRAHQNACASCTGQKEDKADAKREALKRAGGGKWHPSPPPCLASIHRCVHLQQGKVKTPLTCQQPLRGCWQVHGHLGRCAASSTPATVGGVGGYAADLLCWRSCASWTFGWVGLLLACMQDLNLLRSKFRTMHACMQKFTIAFLQSSTRSRNSKFEIRSSAHSSTHDRIVFDHCLTWGGAKAFSRGASVPNKNPSALPEMIAQCTGVLVRRESLVQKSLCAAGKAWAV